MLEFLTSPMTSGTVSLSSALTDLFVVFSLLSVSVFVIASVVKLVRSK